MKTAIVTGVNGQDGSYLAEFLLERDYKVIGVRRRSASSSLWRLRDVLNKPNFELVEGDITDFSSCLSLIQTYRPDEVYNLAAQSHVGTSFAQPLYTLDVTGRAIFNLLDSIRLTNSSARFYQASSSEMFGDVFDIKMEDRGSVIVTTRFQNEDTRFNPQSPYAIAKLAAHQAVKLYRQAYGMFAVGGILFNHESPRRGLNFVTRKITSYYNKARNTKNPKLQLGNLDACRDWGYAKEYVEAMWLMLQQSEPKDYVIGTGKTHTVYDFLSAVHKWHLDNAWFVRPELEELAEINKSLIRPAEVPYLRADMSLANKELGWEAKTSFEELVSIMCENENGLE